MINLKKYYWALVLVNILALAAAIYLTMVHFKPDLSDFCNISEGWNCEIVNKSIYSTLFGIPVSLIGSIAYFAFLIFSIRGLKTDQSKLIPYFLFFVSVGTLFALYLTGIEAFVLKTFCMFCVAQQILILIDLGIAIKLYLLTKKHA